MSLIDDTSPEFNNDWLEEARSDLTTCFVDVASYLEERQGDTPSQMSLIDVVTQKQKVKYVLSWRENGYYKDKSSRDTRKDLPKMMSQLKVSSLPSNVEVAKSVDGIGRDIEMESKSIKSYQSTPILKIEN